MTYLEARPPRPRRSDPDDFAPWELEALAGYPVDALLWRLAGKEGLPFSGIGDVLNAPAPVLFQAEVMADALERLDRKREVEQSMKQALDRARGRRG